MIMASLMRRRSRMIVALLSIVIGATILSGLITIYYDVPRQMGAQFRNYGANMIFTAASDSPLTPSDVSEAVDLIDSSAVVGVAPYQYVNVRIRETIAIAAATDMEGAQATSPYWSITGEWPSQSGELLLGADVADNYALYVGDSITVTYTPEEAAEDESVLDNYIDFKVVGIVETGGSEEEYAYMSLEDMATLTGLATTYDVVELSISATSDELNSYVETINSSTENVSAKLVKKVTASETQVLGKLQALVLIVTVIVLALTMITVATTMTAVVTERRKEIGLRKALGASNSSIIGEFMGEQLVLAAIGGLLGSLLGFAFAQFISVNVFSSSISFRFYLLPLTIVVSMAVTCLACILPIRSATDIEPALVLKGE